MPDGQPSKKERYQPTPADHAWLLCRLGYYALQILLFLVIVYRVGPNLWLFQSPFSPGPGDYVAFTKDYAPMIAAIKAYNRDFGKLPFDSADLPQEYQPWGFTRDHGEILDTTSITFPVDKHGVLEYEFSPKSEGWIVHSPRYDGPLPVPIVPAAPKPATRTSPSSQISPRGGN